MYTYRLYMQTAFLRSQTRLHSAVRFETMFTSIGKSKRHEMTRSFFHNLTAAYTSGVARAASEHFKSGA